MQHYQHTVTKASPKPTNKMPVHFSKWVPVLKTPQS